MTTETATRETLEEFVARALEWLPANLALRADVPDEGNDENQIFEREKANQKKLWGARFAGICYPAEYGGLGYPIEYQQAFNEVSDIYDVPYRLNFGTLCVTLPTVLSIGTEEQKRQHIPAVLRGEEYLCQFLSEPSGGSDLASARTRADREGDGWRVNGSKIWSSSAHGAEYGFLLARTNWDSVKHAGLTFFLIKVDQPGITVNRITRVDGNREFCEVFFDDLYLTDKDVIGEVNEGWAAVSVQLDHERQAMGGGSPYVSGVGPNRLAKPELGLPELAAMLGVDKDPAVREQLADAHVREVVQAQLVERITEGIKSGVLPPTAGTIIRVNHAVSEWHANDIGLSIAGRSVLAIGTQKSGPAKFAHEYLMRQATGIAGGTLEMSRNVMTERLLGMPREAAADRGVPFSEVKTSR